MVTEMQPVVGMELVDLRAALGGGEPAFRARQIYDAVYRQRVTELGVISTVSKAVQDQLAREPPLGFRLLALHRALANTRGGEEREGR
jgi:23S rRNA (adenine2503-C2)-methyltransferase